jgi:hypothetical protein
MESGKPSVDQVAPLDNKAPARHIWRLVVGVKPQGFLAGRTICVAVALAMRSAAMDTPPRW